jgi:hypothetical protein
MLNLIIGTLYLIDNQRRQLKAIVTALCLHFAMLIAIHAGIQFVSNKWMNLANALFGVIWMAGAIVMLWMGGGRPIDVIFGTYIATNGRNTVTAFDHALARTLIGFFTVESFVNIVFTVLPFYASAAGFGLALVATPSYFMFRHMSRQTIDWSRWVWFPAVNIALGFLVCIWCALAPVVTKFVTDWLG